VRDLEQIQNDKQISETTRQALINARLGQGQFRADLERRWNGLCAVTGCGISAMLRASHVKPWAKSSNRDRLNPINGILLAAHLDALFDCGLISFGDNGAMLVSAQIADDVRQFNFPNRLRREPAKQEKRFLAYHRRYVFVA
jgi:predicted restriction endonuclease